MAKRRKKYKGIVLNKFRVQGDVFEKKAEFETFDKDLYNYLINNKNLKS